MDMDSGYEDFKKELKQGGFQILPVKYQEKFYKRLLFKSKNKLDLMQRLEKEGFNKYLIMLLMGTIIMGEQAKKERISLLPSFLRRR